MAKNTNEELWQILKAAAPDSITWNHYDLAVNTTVNDPDIWKKFLNKPEVIDWVNEEQKMLQRYELAKLSTNVADTRSVGQAQLISAMDKINTANEAHTKKGPIFIYSYVPLNKQQEHADNVQTVPYDVFLANNVQPEEGTDNDVPQFTF